MHKHMPKLMGQCKSQAIARRTGVHKKDRGKAGNELADGIQALRMKWQYPDKTAAVFDRTDEIIDRPHWQ